MRDDIDAEQRVGAPGVPGGGRRQWAVPMAFAISAALLAADAPVGGADRDVETDVEPEDSRDPWQRPFSSDSIWNTAIGDQAEFRPANLPYTEQHALEHVYLLKMSETDPEQPLIRIGSWRDRCSGTEAADITVNLPDGWAPENVDETGPTPNNQGVFLQPDGRTLVNVGSMGRCDPTGPLFAEWPGRDQHLTDLYGDGQYGAHGASKLSQLGGAIRTGELTGDEPIEHALSLLISAEHLYWGGSRGNSYLWPATDADAYAGPDTYRGTDPELRMGSLLALPADMTPEQLGVSTDVGRQLFQALQDYGAYITDDSAWDATYLGVESEAIGTIPWGDAERNDMAQMTQALHVIVNNGPSSIGGGGHPRRPPHPELTPPTDRTSSAPAGCARTERPIGRTE